MITDYKITEIFCAVDEFCKEFDKEVDKKSLMSSDGKPRRYRKASLSDSEIMTILIVFQFGSFRNFKHYYLFFIKQHLKSDFPNAVSYTRFVELQSRVFFQMMFFLNLSAFGRISPRLFDMLFEDGIHLVTGIRTNMKNKLMPMWDKIMLRKRCIIETINDMLKNTAQLVHSRHRSVNNFIMNMVAALAAYCFFDNKSQALQGYYIENTKQLMMF